MPNYTTQTQTGRSINSKKTLCGSLNGRFPRDDQNFEEIIEQCKNLVRIEYPQVSNDAFKNVTGSWYEWLVILGGKKYNLDNPDSNILIKLPKISQFDCSTLYEEELFRLIKELRNKVMEDSNVSLITSNPDFVILKRETLNYSILNLNVVSTDLLNWVDSEYTNCIHVCGFEDIIGYIAAKYSLRPDRRLQIPHEGSLMKALYTHLQTRLWVTTPKGIKFYAISKKIGNADSKALRTVATHSITTVTSKPEPAVDGLKSITTINDCYSFFEEILNP